MVALIHCPRCGTIFKIVKHRITGEGIIFITDFDDFIYLSNHKYLTCIHCQHRFDFNSQVYMSTEDWIAEQLFNIKP